MPNKSIHHYSSLSSASGDARPAIETFQAYQGTDTKAQQELDLVNGLLSNPGAGLRLPSAIENIFQAEVSETRLHFYVRMGIFGIIAYNSFLIPDQNILPDIFNLILIVQLLIVTPLTLATLYAIHRRVVRPEPATTAILLMIFGTIIYFYSQSGSELAPFLIFTIPVALVFGNVVLPLPFVNSVWLTVMLLGSSSLVAVMRPGWDTMLTVFAILVNANSGMYMLFGTYRMERSERRAFLYNLRERLRADVLGEKNEHLKSLSETDGLTGVPNRRCFDIALEHLWQGAAETAEPLALFIVDIDHFKKLNDTLGHQEGDRCLTAVAQCLKAHLMPNATLARYGGEEFVVLLPGVNDLYARSCAEVLRSAVSRLSLTSNNGYPFQVTVSVGTASMIPAPAQRSATLLTAADQALYRAKANGRNRVESAIALGTDVTAVTGDVAGAEIRLSA